jgi:hypothetical protein
MSNTAPSGATENSPAIYRWENAPKETTSPAGTKESIEQPSFILNSVLFEDSDQFIVERMHLMMLFLRFNIPDCGFDARNSNAESAISFLPFKQTKVGNVS